MENKENTEAVQTAAETPATKTVSVDLTAEQYAFLTGWQKTHEKELGIEVPIGALVRKTVEAAMNAANRPSRDDKPGFGDRGAPRGRPAGRPSFGDKPERGGDRPAGRSFGDRKPSFGGDRGAPRGRPAGRPAGRGPKFDMLSGAKPRRFDK